MIKVQATLDSCLIKIPLAPLDISINEHILEYLSLFFDIQCYHPPSPFQL